MISIENVGITSAQVSLTRFIYNTTKPTGLNPSRKSKEPYPDGLGYMGWLTIGDLPIGNAE